MTAADRPSRKTRTGKRAKAALIAAAATAFAAASTPAFAGGGYYGGYDGYYGGSGYYGHGYGGRGYYGRGYDRGGHGHGRHHGRGGLSGGEAALIAVGIIGGAILIDRALDDRRDRDYDRYDDRRYRGRDYDDRRRAGAFDDDYYYQRDSRPYQYDGDIRSARRDEPGGYGAGEPDLLGGEPRSRSADRVAVNAAFRECVAETRGAAGAGGLTVAMPGAPTDLETLADGSVRMVAQFRASNARGEEWSRRFVCEA
ncbi:MAG TPA: hypothetical protein DDZ68_00135, partial [Parvularcula sp.]|nr:hypothetical protein [Parvularcula sp.]HBS33291.1 hypothetical protein [Parvularcula sp.]